MEVQLICKAINSKPSPLAQGQANQQDAPIVHAHAQSNQFQAPIVHEHHQQFVLLSSLALEMQARGLPHAHKFLTFTTKTPASYPA